MPMNTLRKKHRKSDDGQTILSRPVERIQIKCKIIRRILPGRKKRTMEKVRLCIDVVKADPQINALKHRHAESKKSIRNRALLTITLNVCLLRLFSLFNKS